MIIKERTLGSQQLSGIDPVLARILLGRGVSSNAEVSYGLQQMLDWRLLKDMDRATERLYQAYQQQERVIILGDYDVDGATSTTLLVSGLREMGFIAVDFIIPNRMTDGYGLTPKMIDRALDQGCDLLITVDNGIVSFQAVDYAKEKGLDVLITDHHLAADTVPDAIIINPNQPGCSFPSKCIAGVGVAFYLLVGLRAYFREKGVFEKGPNLLNQLDLVALGTIADCVPLDYNNRNLVANGLALMRKGKARVGVQALLGVAKRNPSWVEADDMGFAIAPRLNAAGRLEDMTIGVRCLLATNAQDAKYYAGMLDDINRTRQTMQSSMTEEALAYVQSFTSVPKVAVVIKPKWHEGIIGLVASMIKERFHIPSMVLTQDENPKWLKGSCRSIMGLNIRDVLAEYDRRYPGSLIKFGGHAMACGFTLNQKDSHQFQLAIIDICENLITEDMQKKYLWVDGSLPPSHRTIGFTKSLMLTTPWGNGFEKPVFYDVFKLCDQYIVGGKHLKLVLEDESVLYPGIMFNIEEGSWPKHRVKTVKCAYQIAMNEFNGKRTFQLLVLHLEPVEV